MNEAEWRACTEPRPMLEFLGSRASARKLRLFACACCRRIWHLLTDERCRKAVEAAERYADGAVSPDQFAAFRDAAHEAFLQAKQAEYHTEADAEFCDSVNYSHTCALLYAAAAVRAAVAVKADQTIDLLDAYHRDETEWERQGERWDRCGRPCHYWGAAAAGGAERASAYTAQGWTGPEVIWDGGGPEVKGAEEAAERREAGEQAALLRCILGNPFHPVTANPAWLAWDGGTVAKLTAAAYDARAFDRLPILADALEEAGCADEALLSHLRGTGPHVRGCWAVDLLLRKS